MPGTYTQLLLHVVFSTKHREPRISPTIAARLHPYLGGIITTERCQSLAIGGVDDHIHLYLRARPDIALSDLMREVKSRSSKWIHESFPAQAEFEWQTGYAAFAVSKSLEPEVKRYIARQAEHHAKQDFKAELLHMLRINDIEFDERYIFD